MRSYPSTHRYLATSGAAHLRSCTCTAAFFPLSQKCRPMVMIPHAMEVPPTAYPMSPVPRLRHPSTTSTHPVPNGNCTKPISRERQRIECVWLAVVAKDAKWRPKRTAHEAWKHLEGSSGNENSTHYKEQSDDEREQLKCCERAALREQRWRSREVC